MNPLLSLLLLLPFGVPLDRPCERVTKKPFGIHITPQTSPVRPEKFSGYHTGVDFETFDDESSVTIAVRAICNGRIIEKRYAKGYGGVVVTSGMYRGDDITVVYGHLSLTSVTRQMGDSIRTGEILGHLGNPAQGETDGERKHLHLSVHRGKTVNIRGYVKTKTELKEWIDPMEFLSCQ